MRCALDKELTEKEVYDLACEGATESAELVTKSHLSLTGASEKVLLLLLPVMMKKQYFLQQKDMIENSAKAIGRWMGRECLLVYTRKILLKH